MTTADLASARVVASPAGSAAWVPVSAPDTAAKPAAGTSRPIPLSVPAGDVLTILVSGPDASQALVVSSPGGRLSDQKDKQSTQTRRVDRIDLAGGRVLGGFEIPSVSTPVAFSPGASHFLLTHSGSSDRVDVHNAADGKHVAGWRPYEKESGDNRKVAWADFLDSKRVLTVNPAGTLILWTVPGCKAIYVARQALVGVPILGPDRKVLAALRGGVLRLLDPATGEPRGDATSTGHDDARGLKAAAFAPDGQELAAVLDGTIVRWDLKTGQVVGESPVARPQGGLAPVWLRPPRFARRQDSLRPRRQAGGLLVLWRRSPAGRLECAAPLCRRRRDHRQGDAQNDRGAREEGRPRRGRLRRLPPGRALPRGRR